MEEERYFWNMEFRYIPTQKKRSRKKSEEIEQMEEVRLF